MSLFLLYDNFPVFVIGGIWFPQDCPWWEIWEWKLANFTSTADSVPNIAVDESASKVLDFCVFKIRVVLYDMEKRNN